MSMLQAADAFQRFLASNGMDGKGVRVIIEFDNVDKAYRTRQCIQKEFEHMMCGKGTEFLNNLKIAGMPFSLVAKV